LFFSIFRSKDDSGIFTRSQAHALRTQQLQLKTRSSNSLPRTSRSSTNTHVLRT